MTRKHKHENLNFLVTGLCFMVIFLFVISCYHGNKLVKLQERVEGLENITSSLERECIETEEILSGSKTLIQDSEIWYVWYDDELMAHKFLVGEELLPHYSKYCLLTDIRPKPGYGLEFVYYANCDNFIFAYNSTLKESTTEFVPNYKTTCTKEQLVGKTREVNYEIV